MSGKINTNEKEEYDDVPLPGFRFHPTDEELVGFYLRRKVEKQPVAIELIKHADIYKYDPWDLPKSSSVEDQKEWYFFCKRGRKYKNSVRPNRVTGSGFWKATGIDRPIYKGRDCIGLKKSLVYYRGSAGKGTKTEWMMHEFRLPPPAAHTTAKPTNTQTDATTIAQEVEVWTLCRILKRNISHKKSESGRCIKGNANVMNTRLECCDQNIAQRRYISFQQNHEIENKLFSSSSNHVFQNNTANQQFEGYFSTSTISEASSYSTDISEELLSHADWEDLRSILNYVAC